MKIQQFQAETVSQALKKVQEVLGPNAKVLNTEPSPDGDGVLVMAGVPATPSPSVSRPRSRGGKDRSLAESIHEIREEMSELREALAAGNPEGRISFAGVPGADEVERRLRANGVAPRLRKKIVEIAASRSSGIELMAAASQAIEDLVPIWSPKAEAGKPRAIAFVGPTGAGKTTTLAKLAGRLVHEAKKSVALLTTDTYRVAAVEQLRAYANMLGCPFDVAFTPADAARALEERKNYDAILIDTAGRSPFDAARIREMSGFLGLGGTVETLLVLSAATATDVAEETIERFAPTTPEGIVLTKLDETLRPGSLFQLLVEEQLPVAYLTDGQEVPADLERATGEKIAQRLLASAASASLPVQEAGL